jgi:hypothetical protein
MFWENDRLMGKERMRCIRGADGPLLMRYTANALTDATALLRHRMALQTLDLQRLVPE